jgi:hypothetical protein
LTRIPEKLRSVPRMLLKIELREDEFARGFVLDPRRGEGAELRRVEIVRGVCAGCVEGVEGVEEVDVGVVVELVSRRVETERGCVVVEEEEMELRRVETERGCVELGVGMAAAKYGSASRFVEVMNAAGRVRLLGAGVLASVGVVEGGGVVGGETNAFIGCVGVGEGEGEVEGTTEGAWLVMSGTMLVGSIFTLIFVSGGGMSSGKRSGMEGCCPGEVSPESGGREGREGGKERATACFMKFRRYESCSFISLFSVSKSSIFAVI